MIQDIRNKHRYDYKNKSIVKVAHQNEEKLRSLEEAESRLI